MTWPKDIAEQNNLAEQHPEIFAKLSKRMKKSTEKLINISDRLGRNLGKRS